MRPPWVFCSEAGAPLDLYKVTRVYKRVLRATAPPNFWAHHSAGPQLSPDRTSARTLTITTRRNACHWTLPSATGVCEAGVDPDTGAVALVSYVARDGG
jgi:hypothetical protein